MYVHKLNAVARSINESYTRKLQQISLLPKQRITVPIVRLRKPEDTMESLKNSKLSGCYLRLYSEDFKNNEVVHFVLEQKQLAALKRQKDLKIKPIYIQINGVEYRTLLDTITTHPSSLLLPSLRMDRKRCVQ